VSYPEVKRMRGILWSVLLLAVVTLAVGNTTLRSAFDDVSDELTLLTNHLGFSDNNLSALARGQIIRKTLESKDPSEVVAVGAVRVSVPLEFLLDQVRDIVGFKKSKFVLEVGTFSTPPRLEDLARLTVPADDIEDIRRCKPGDCKIKLTREMVDRLQKEVDWSIADARTRAGTVLKRLLVERAAAYLAGGVETLGTYADRHGSSVSHELANLLSTSKSLTDHAPDLRRFLEEFPRHQLRDAESFLYWSKESYGPKPAISLTHVTIFTKTLGDRRMSFVASSGLYSSHYLEGSLGLAMALEAGGSSPPAHYLVYVNRSRVDALRGVLSGVRRWVAVRRVRDGLESTLRELKTRLEKDYAASQRT